jgi:bifunctional DNA-binding transcriptional regulator/antitoxin component of YhaV-PrlF toxin-antitoxin module
MKAKLQKQLAYKYKDKHHYKHVIVIPDDAINELGWKGGQELEINVKNGQLIVAIEKNTKKGGEKKSN